MQSRGYSEPWLGLLASLNAILSDFEKPANKKDLPVGAPDLWLHKRVHLAGALYSLC
jgi:hypothetical protein